MSPLSPEESWKGQTREESVRICQLNRYGEDVQPKGKPNSHFCSIAGFVCRAIGIDDGSVDVKLYDDGKMAVRTSTYVRT